MQLKSLNLKSLNKDSKEISLREKTESLLTKAGFVNKVFVGYKLWKVQGGDILWVRTYPTKLEVYPISNWDAYKSNTVHYKDIDFDKNIFLTLLNNSKK